MDVVVCTYNSALYLDQCLKSIWRNVPVNQLYVVDKHSTDATPDIARENGATIVNCEGSLSEARRVSFNLCETRLIVNVDSDVVLCEGWFRKVMQYWQGLNVGCVWGLAVDQDTMHQAYAEGMWRIRRGETYNLAHLPDMVALREVIADIKFNPWLQSGSVANEDYAIKGWIEKKGYRCVTAPVKVAHYSYPPMIDTKTYWYGASSRCTRLVSFKNLMFRLALCVPQAIVVGLLQRNPRLITYWVRFRLQSLFGWLHWKKYVYLNRKPK